MGVDAGAGVGVGTVAGRGGRATDADVFAAVSELEVTGGVGGAAGIGGDAVNGCAGDAIRGLFSGCSSK